jgi:hypothetical protein
MSGFIAKALISGLIIAIVSEVARRSATMGALVASLPLVSVIGMIWIWSQTHDKTRIADHAGATFWYVLPSMPMFLVMPLLIRSGMGFWAALGVGCTLTIVLYLVLIGLAHRFGLRL